VCGALDFSHRNGIVHRDIKPANVMITPTGAVKVMDFGIARALADNAATVTQTANVIGTAQYLSPEQARGEAVDARSDVYSVGCLLYELVTGVPPFQGDSPVAVAYQHVRENAPAPSTRNPQVPPALDSIVMKALAKNPLNRYQSAGEMRTDLQRGLANQPVAAEAVMTDAERTQFIARGPMPPVAVRRQVETPPSEPDDSRRSGLVWAAIVAALLLVIGAAVAAVLLIGKSDSVKQVVIPQSIIGELPSAASDTLRNLGFTPAQGSDTNGPCFGDATVDKGKVCLSNPAPNTKANKGATVTFQLYTPKQVQVPDVTGKLYTDAAAVLHQAGLGAKQTVVHDPHPVGTVIAQSVQPFTPVAPGTVVTLNVSDGKSVLPSVVGKPLQTAKQTLNAAGWTNIDSSQTTPTKDKNKDGTVATEDPTPGIPYPQNQKITLVVYQYVAPSPVVSCSTPPPVTSITVSGVPPSPVTVTSTPPPVCTTTTP
jgi:serine/threonine-protein kinase